MNEVIYSLPQDAALCLVITQYFNGIAVECIYSSISQTFEVVESGLVIPAYICESWELKSE